jgi:hypothetical protein
MFKEKKTSERGSAENTMSTIQMSVAILEK